MTIYLGVDAGNSKTLAAVCSERGEVLGWGRAGVGDIYADAGAESALNEVVSAIADALADADVELAQVRHGAFRLAGVDWDADEDYWRGAIRRRLSQLTSASVKNDGFALLRFASDDGCGVSIVAGTGPAIAARGKDGREFNLSWWFQDLLGGLGIGEAAFRAVVLAELGSRQPTALKDHLLTLHGHRDVRGLLEAFTRRIGPVPRSAHSKAVRLVLDLAAAGDEVAQGIVTDQADKLALYASAAAAKVGFDLAEDVVPIALGGGVLNSENTMFRDVLRASIALAMPHAQIGPATATPITGTLLDALVEGGVRLTSEVRARLVSFDYPAHLLKT
jgi:N-acetylglucosamine kinase-like BadF-type ATPase